MARSPASLVLALFLVHFFLCVSSGSSQSLPDHRSGSSSSGSSDARRKRVPLNLFGFGSKPKNDVSTPSECSTCVTPPRCSMGQDFNSDYSCTLANNEPGVCCPEGRIVSSEDEAPPSPVPVSITIETDTEDELDSRALALIGEPYLCGYNGKKASRIHGGKESGVKDWPWMAVLLRSDDFFHYCGGVLITRRHVLTAAHCVYRSKKEDILVRLGEYDFNEINETRITDMKVKEIRSHKDFDGSNYQHDIAVLVLAQRVNYEIYVQPICLPPWGPRYENHTAIVAGWGTLFYAGPMSEVLMEVSVPVWPNHMCQKSFTQPILETTLCAGAHEGGRDSCQGDSGGPLMYQRPEDNRWITIGVVSWGVRCGDKGKPGIYTRVNDYLPWLASRIRDV